MPTTTKKVSDNDVAGMLDILRLGKGVYRELCGALGLVVASSVAVMASARILGALVEEITRDPASRNLLPLAASFLGLETASVGCQYIGRMNLSRATVVISQNIREQLFQKMQTLPIRYFDKQPLGRIITRLTADVEGIETFFNGTLARLIIAVINIATVLIAMVFTDVKFGILIVSICMPALLFSFAFRRPVVYWLRTYKARSAEVNARLAEYLGGITVIKVFGLEEWTKNHFTRLSDEQLSAGLSTMNWNSVLRPMAVFLCSVPMLLILWLGGEKVIAGAMPLGVLVAFVRYGERFVSPIRVISTEVQNIQEAVVSGERVRRMLFEADEDTYLGKDGTVNQEIIGDIVFEHVSMSYDEKQVLNDISFHIKPGMKVGLVGKTGSGKTSTINLIPRLYPFQSGRILIDGIDISEWQRAALRKGIGYVSQDVVIFTGTLRENLISAMPNPDISDEMIWQAAHETGLDQIIANYTDGLDHQILEGGENLSMGERQLVAFTRMLLRNPRIMILDEATSNVDETAEAMIQAALEKLMANRTCLVIAHRLKTVAECDMLIRFADGKATIERHAKLEKTDNPKIWEPSETIPTERLDNLPHQGTFSSLQS